MITCLRAAPRCGALLLMTALCASAPADDMPSKAVADAAGIEGTITFLYYDDLPAAARFYGEVLGLTLTMDEDWVKIFEVTGASSVGLVRKGHGFHEPSEDKPVMLSLVTADVDGWQDRLRRAGATVLKPLPTADDSQDPGSAPIRGFIVADPGGYTVEFFSWQRPDRD